MISWFEKHHKLSWIITVIIAVTIFYLSSLTFDPGIAGTNLLAITYHILAFFFLALFLMISLTKGKNKELIFLAIIITLSYSLTDELHQFFVPGRDSSFSDVFLDTIGITFASLIYFISLEYRSIKNNINHK